MTNEEARVVEKAAFTLESVTHLGGLERACLRSADALRGLLTQRQLLQDSCVDCGSQQWFVRRLMTGGGVCGHGWHGEEAQEARHAARQKPTYEELEGLVNWLCTKHEDSILPITVIAAVHTMNERLRKSK